MDRAIIKKGLFDSVIYGFGFIFLYIAIGVLAHQHPMSFAQSTSMTIAIFSTPLQFLLVIPTHNPLLLIPIILAMNARFLLMSAYLTPYFREVKLFKLILACIFMTPSVFTAASMEFKKKIKQPLQYFVSVGAPIYIISILSCVVGFYLSSRLDTPFLVRIIDMILPIQFTALAAKNWPNIPAVSSYWAGFLVAPFSINILGEYSLFITPILIGIVALIAEPKTQDKK